MSRRRTAPPLTLTRMPGYIVTPVAGWDADGRDWLAIDTDDLGMTLACAGCRETFRYGYAPMEWPITRCYCVKCVAFVDADTAENAQKAVQSDEGGTS